MKDGPSAWAHATHVGDSDEVSSFWLTPDQVLSILAIWRVNQLIGDSLSLFLSTYLSVSLSVSPCL